MNKYLSRVKGLQNKLKQVSTADALSNERFVHTICKGIPDNYESTKKLVTGIMTEDRNRSLETIYHILTMAYVRKNHTKKNNNRNKNSSRSTGTGSIEDASYAMNNERIISHI